MAHWGWYWKVKLKHKPKTLCSSLTSIDIHSFFKGNSKDGFKVPDYQLTAMPLEDRFAITYGKNKKPSYFIKFEKQVCNFGGYRYYFHCPLCKKRMRKLYFNGGVFLCRKCLNLGYFSQRLVASKRNMFLTSKIEKELKAKGGSLYDKPKYMKRKTFEWLRDKHFEYELKWDNALRSELLSYYPNKRDEILRLI